MHRIYRKKHTASSSVSSVKYQKTPPIKSTHPQSTHALLFPNTRPTLQNKNTLAAPVRNQTRSRYPAREKRCTQFDHFQTSAIESNTQGRQYSIVDPKNSIQPMGQNRRSFLPQSNLSSKNKQPRSRWFANSFVVEYYLFHVTYVPGARKKLQRWHYQSTLLERTALSTDRSSIGTWCVFKKWTPICA